MSINQDEKIRKKKDMLSQRPKVLLFNEKQWLYLKKSYHLTPRETQVAILICRGYDNNEIAEFLKIKKGTVKTHLRNIYRRAFVENKVLLLLRFLEDIDKSYASEGKPQSDIPIKEIPSKSVSMSKAFTEK